MQKVIVRNSNNDLDTLELPIKLLLFILSPFIAFLASLLKPASKSSYVIYFLFGMIFSWSMYYKGEGIDFNNIVLRFYDQYGTTFREVIDGIFNIFSEESRHKDCYNLILNWITSQFTRNFHALFLLASIPYLFLLTKSLKVFTNDARFKNNIFCLLILFLFVLPKGIFDIQNFRFSTATWMVVYGILQLYVFNNKKSIFLIFLTPFVHSSFWFFVFVFIFYLLFSTRMESKLKILFYCSIPFAFISSNIVNFIDTSMLPSIFAKWVDGYLSDEAMSDFGMHNFMSGSGMYLIGVFFTLARTFFYLLIPILILNSNRLDSIDVRYKKMFYFGLFFFSIVNFIQPIPVLGSRFWGIWRMLSIVLWFKIMWPEGKKYLLLLAFSCLHELVYMTIPSYLKVVENDFFYSNLFSLIAKHWGIYNF